MEEELKQLMGDNYHEGMTGAEVQEYFKKSLLESGNYVNKEASDASIAKLQKELADKNNQIKAKMTDDEKKKAEINQQLAEFEELKKKYKEQTISSNKYQAQGLTASVKEKAKIKDDDKEFDEFLTSISSEDGEKTAKISKYIAKIVNAAYENGKAEMTKEKMAKMGSFKKDSETDDNGKNVDWAKELAKSNINKTKNNYYFQ